MPLVTIDPGLCLKDGLCVRICHKVFSRKAEDAVPEVEHEALCNACGHCALICPSGAIRLEGVPADKIHPVRRDIIPSYEQVRELIATRRSIRTFQKRSVEKEAIEKIIEGARFAPSAKNTGSTRFMVVQDGTLLRAIASATADWLGKVAKKLKNPVWRKLYVMSGAGDAEEMTKWIGQFSLMAENMRQGTDHVLFEAPALILFHADRSVRFADENANLALQNGTLIACSLGLGSFYTGYVVTAAGHDKTIPRLVGLPKGQKIYGGLALGYPEIRFSRWVERNPATVRWM